MVQNPKHHKNFHCNGTAIHKTQAGNQLSLISSFDCDPSKTMRFIIETQGRPDVHNFAVGCLTVFVTGLTIALSVQELVLHNLTPVELLDLDSGDIAAQNLSSPTHLLVNGTYYLLSPMTEEPLERPERYSKGWWFIVLWWTFFLAWLSFSSARMFFGLRYDVVSVHGAM